MSTAFVKFPWVVLQLHIVLDLVRGLCLPDGAHLGELVDRLVAVVDVLPEEVGELLEAKDLERAVGRDLADGRGQEAVDVVAVARLHEDRRVRQAGRKYLDGYRNETISNDMS